MLRSCIGTAFALAALLAGCSTLGGPSDHEVVRLYRLYDDGQCAELSARASRVDWAVVDRSRKPFFDLMTGYCLEIGGDVDAAQGLYTAIVADAPLSYQAYEASLRLAELRRVAEGGTTREQLAARVHTDPPYQHGIRPIHRREPNYPAAMRVARLTGWVVVDFAISASGGMVDPVVEASHPPFVFEGLALEAIRDWTYEPSASGAERRSRIRIDFDSKY